VSVCARTLPITPHKFRIWELLFRYRTVFFSIEHRPYERLHSLIASPIIVHFDIVLQKKFIRCESSCTIIIQI
jgi:hypothetical protein